MVNTYNLLTIQPAFMTPVCFIMELSLFWSSSYLEMPVWSTPHPPLKVKEEEPSFQIKLLI